jgi:hypothetical protein
LGGTGFKQSLTLKFASRFSLKYAHPCALWRKNQSILLCGGKPFEKGLSEIF